VHKGTDLKTAIRLAAKRTRDQVLRDWLLSVAADGRPEQSDREICRPFRKRAAREERIAELIPA
jgi:hypothetical protein